MFLKNNPGKVVTRYQFSELFREAWLKGMTMSNVIAGFKTTGIYPFNPQALLPMPSPVSSRFQGRSIHADISYIPLFSPLPNRYNPGHINLQQSFGNNMLDSISSSEELPSLDFSFSEEELDLFTRRYEKGYNIYDERYEEWKKIHKESNTDISSGHPKNIVMPENTRLNHHSTFSSV